MWMGLMPVKYKRVEEMLWSSILSFLSNGQMGKGVGGWSWPLIPRALRMDRFCWIGRKENDTTAFISVFCTLHVLIVLVRLRQ